MPSWHRLPRAWVRAGGGSREAMGGTYFPLLLGDVA